jgi:hypothetical protein
VNLFVLVIFKIGFYNPRYSEGRDQEDYDSNTAQENSSRDFISKNFITEKSWWSGSRFKP